VSHQTALAAGACRPAPGWPPKRDCPGSRHVATTRSTMSLGSRDGSTPPAGSRRSWGSVGRPTTPMGVGPGPPGANGDAAFFFRPHTTGQRRGRTGAWACAQHGFARACPSPRRWLARPAFLTTPTENSTQRLKTKGEGNNLSLFAVNLFTTVSRTPPFAASFYTRPSFLGVTRPSSLR
jgi:hypothetical protein